ncbi:YpfB family protein [Bacillus sp. FJAT-27245]|uniref:YpfB family protein n=1 Tax=Bacillus sp. FJAT-27245 TaxID=1684144 RepID=UPI0006A7914C|nr:YpfB family protein [Bacillus sp. FJAT-27245]
MKFAERILIKAVIAQFIFLLLAQFLFHRFGVLPELKGVTKYEGIGKMDHSDMLEVFRGSKGR